MLIWYLGMKQKQLGASSFPSKVGKFRMKGIYLNIHLFEYILIWGYLLFEDIYIYLLEKTLMMGGIGGRRRRG